MCRVEQFRDASNSVVQRVLRLVREGRLVRACLARLLPLFVGIVVLAGVSGPGFEVTSASAQTKAPPTIKITAISIPVAVYTPPTTAAPSGGGSGCLTAAAFVCVTAAPTSPPTSPPTAPPAPESTYPPKCSATSCTVSTAGPVTTTPIIVDSCFGASCGTTTLPGVRITTTQPPTTVLRDEPNISIQNADLGSVGVGLTTPPQSVVVVNDGTIPLRLLKASVEGPFKLAAGSTCINGNVLNPRQTCSIPVTYTATIAGEETGKVTIGALAPDGNLSATGSLRGSGSKNQLAIDPPIADLGTLVLGNPIPEVNMLVRNTGSGPVRVTTVALTAKSAEFFINAKACVGVTLPPKGTCAFRVVLKVKKGGNKTIGVRATGASGEAATATIRGKIATARLVFAPAGLVLGNATVGQSAPPKPATIKNAGDIAVQVSSVKLSGPQAGDFSIASDGCTGKSLAPGKTCPLTVAGKPSAAGGRSVGVVVTGSLKTSAKGSVRLVGVLPTTTVRATTPPVTTVPKKVTTVPKSVTTVPGPVVTVPPTPAPTTTPPTTVARRTPKLIMNPAVAVPGRVTNAIGSGFPPNTIVSLAWAGEAVLRDVPTDENGNFRVPVFLLPNEPVGGRFMTVVDQEPVFGGVRAPFLLQLPTFKPPGQDGRSGQLVNR